MLLRGFFMAVFLGFLASGIEGAELTKAMGSLKGSLFAVTCDASEESLYSDWSVCVWPHGDLRRVVTQFVTDAREKECKMPPRQLVLVGLRALKESSYKEHPLYKRIPSTECGFCGRKAQCCRKSRSFLTQSFRSAFCNDESPPCETAPIDETLKAELEEKFPALEAPLGSCDFTPFIDQELARLRRDVAFKYIQPLFCQIIGTTRPSVKCEKVGDTCKCCCFGFRYENGRCVQIDETDNLCEA